MFGAAGSGEVCDQGLLVSSLQSNPRAAEGWATVHGITPESISEFVSELTPVVLLEDTLKCTQSHLGPLARVYDVVIEYQGNPFALE